MGSQPSGPGRQRLCPKNGVLASSPVTMFRCERRRGQWFYVRLGQWACNLMLVVNVECFAATEPVLQPT